MNKVLLIGKLVKDWLVKETKNGDKVLLLNLATRKRFKNKKTGKEQEKVDYHNLIAYGDKAKMLSKDIDKFKKDTIISVEGEIDNFSYEVEGIKRYWSRIVIHSLQFVDKEV